MWIWFVRSGMISAWFQCGLKMKFQPLACWNIWPSTSAPGKTFWAQKSVFSNQLFSEPIISPKWSFKPWHYGLTYFHTCFKIYIYWKKKALTVFLCSHQPQKTQTHSKPVPALASPLLRLFAACRAFSGGTIYRLLIEKSLKKNAKPSPYVPLRTKP